MDELERNFFQNKCFMILVGNPERALLRISYLSFQCQMAKTKNPDFSTQITLTQRDILDTGCSLLHEKGMIYFNYSILVPWNSAELKRIGTIY